MIGSLPSGLSLLISSSVRLSDVGRGGVGKGGSWVLTPDLVVMEKSWCFRFRSFAFPDRG
ncbi:hypothetical protein Tco_0479721, partial [Tanacetum coccineum]